MRGVHSFTTGLGTMHLVEENQVITELRLSGGGEPIGERAVSPLLEMAASQVMEYLTGGRKGFTVPIALRGSDFDLLVWNELASIPYGKVRTYGEVAQAIGSPRSARAVGQACHRNPIPIIIPCHRVIGKGEKLTVYAGGLELKRRLLELEKDAIL